MACGSLAAYAVSYGLALICGWVVGYGYVFYWLVLFAGEILGKGNFVFVGPVECIAAYVARVQVIGREYLAGER